MGKTEPPRTLAELTAPGEGQGRELDSASGSGDRDASAGPRKKYQIRIFTVCPRYGRRVVSPLLCLRDVTMLLPARFQLTYNQGKRASFWKD
jgi:hypothetical protein